MAVTPPELVDSLPEGKARGVPKTTVTSIRSRGVVTQPEDRWRSRPAERPFLLEHDILKVHNIDNVDWEFRWDRRKYLVKKGETGFVPFPGVAMMMGDPRSVDGAITRFNTDDGQRGYIPARHEVFTTLYAFYGIANENMDELVDFAPKLEVWTMDDTPVTFPVQNPTMTAWPVPQVAEPGREGSDTRRLIDNLSEDNAAMKAEIAELRGLVSGRLAPGEAPPVGRQDTGMDEGQDEGSLAAALAGAPIDSGPSTQF